MNFLAHLLLSTDNEQIKFGNFVGDAIKGKKFEMFPPTIQKGILLHREIDTFTDHHPLMKKSKKLFKPGFGHYRGVILDVVNDHFLSKNWEKYHTQDLETFLIDFEKTFHSYSHFLTPQSKKFYELFLERKYMHQYHHLEGIKSTLEGLERRIGYKFPLSHAVEDVRENYAKFELNFESFFTEIQQFCTTILNQYDSK